MIFEMRPNEQHASNMLLRNPCTTTVSVIPNYSEHTVNTAQTTYKKSMMVHTEGGWPRDVDPTMPEQVNQIQYFYSYMDYCSSACISLVYALTFLSQVLSRICRETNTDPSRNHPCTSHNKQCKQVSRFRKRIERDEDYIQLLQRLVEGTEPFLKQNNALDIYEMYFDGTTFDHSTETPSARTLTVFRDPVQDGVRRSASYLCMHPGGKSDISLNMIIC